jgi:hypothetical protein
MVCPPATSEAGILSAKVVSYSNINGYLRNYQDCLTLGARPVGTLKDGQTQFLEPFHWTHIVWQVVRRDGDQVDGKWMVDA